eukprot:TRINITY_DN9122_c0_g1_i2.p1 TRINITY_DN9122_c0_g1~~TRINITY_DN9122_c0_g1_i2.p1  ORF type:complete len:247 (-),score=59.99 TRINITY_DN9122_c0_g1_i2:36-755(-)
MSHPRPCVVLFGDSLTQFSFDYNTKGWGLHLSSWYAARADVLNRGFSGYTTRAAKYLVNKIIPSAKEAKVLYTTLWFGANDAAFPPNNQHVPLEEYKQNMIDVIKMIRSHQPSSPVIVITPPPVDIAKWSADCDALKRPESSKCRSQESVAKYAHAAMEAAKEADALLLDIWTLMQQDKDWSRFLSDGLHFSEEGNKFVYDALRDLVKSKIGDAEKLDLYAGQGPAWSALDLQHPENSL